MNGLWDYVILGLILAACVAYMAHKLQRRFRARGGGCGCSCSGAAGACGVPDKSDSKTSCG